jgi:hypothetical protein
MQPRGEHAWADVEPGLVGSADPPSPPVDLLGKRHQREIPVPTMLKAKFELSVIMPLTFSVFALLHPPRLSADGKLGEEEDVFLRSRI